MHLSGLPYVPHDLPKHPKLILLDLITRIIYDEGHRHNLAKSNGGGQKRPWVLETSIYEGVKLQRGGSLF